MRLLVGWVLLLLVWCQPASAQWFNYPTPGIPRTADGSPDLTAPAPRTPGGTPDLSGLWMTSDSKWLVNLDADGVEIPMRPWADALFRERQENFGKDRPSGQCISHGVTDFNALPTPTKIVQTPGITIILFEAYNHYRQILTDGRPLPLDPQPAWLGYSVGRWDGDTFVVDSVGFNERFWFTRGGLPHTEALHLTERFSRPDYNTLQYEVTVDDPRAYTRPWTGRWTIQWVPDEEIQEYFCEEKAEDTFVR